MAILYLDHLRGYNFAINYSILIIGFVNYFIELIFIKSGDQWGGNDLLLCDFKCQYFCFLLLVESILGLEVLSSNTQVPPQCGCVI